MKHGYSCSTAGETSRVKWFGGLSKSVEVATEKKEMSDPRLTYQVDLPQDCKSHI